jgi:hypothetical protein
MVNRKKHSLTEGFFFPFSRPQNRNSDLISVGSSDAGHPAKHLLGLNRAVQSAGPLPLAPQPVFQPRDLTPRSGPETHAVNPWAIHSNEMTAVPIRSGLQFFADLSWGRILQILFVPKLCSDSAVGQLNEPGPVAEPFSSRPRRSRAGDGRWPEFPIKSTESVPRGKPLRGFRAQHRPGVLGHH